MHRRTTTALLALCALVGLAACGDDDETTTSASETTETTEATAEADVPQRIVSISPRATEILYAIGAGDQVVAVDDNSNFPEGVPTTDLSSFEPNVEAIAEYEPDLVVSSSSPQAARPTSAHRASRAVVVRRCKGSVPPVGRVR